MGIYYHQSYSKARGTFNFGDDVNPFLLRKLFDKSIIDSKDICVIGIGTIINDRELSRVDCYQRKIVFSSGVGYGSLDSSRFDETWDFSCVRGPLSAQALGLPEELGISDAGLLIPELFGISGDKFDKKYPVTFIPHAESDLSSGDGLQDLCVSLGIKYLSPRVEAKKFVNEVSRSSKVITEAMHGAIIADAVRVPWVPVKFLVHEPFKWKDWCGSVNLPYNVSDLGLEFWDNRRREFSSWKSAWQFYKRRRVKSALSKVNLSVEPLLSSASIFDQRRIALWDVVRSINERYTK